METLSFQFDWMEADRVQGPELATTWAALQITAGEVPVTRVFDAKAKTVRDCIYVPLYPLAEWLATNWWFINHECGSPSKDGDPKFRRRHALATNREGYAFPALEVIPSGSNTHLSWRRESLQWGRVEFLNAGEIWIDSHDFKESCANFIDQVIRRLAAMNVESTLLQDEWEAIQAADDEEAQFCAAAAGLGWHPYALSDEEQSFVLFCNEKLGALLYEALPAISAGNPSENRRIVDDITRAIPEAQKSHKVPLQRLRSFASTDGLTVRATVSPWKAGYEQARRFRDSLNLQNDPFPTLMDLADALDEDVDLVTNAAQPVGIFPRNSIIDGVVTKADDGNPALGLRPLNESQKTFYLCRALSEILTDPAADALITRAYSERQRLNRAFAAEFLAPSAGLRERVANNVADDDAIDELASVFGVSSRVIEHQLVNHRIAKIPRWETP